MDLKNNTYDQFANEYSSMIDSWEIVEVFGLIRDLLIPRILDYVGDISGMNVLDAGCGEGYIARKLKNQGAKITAIDISPRLIQIARTKDDGADIEYLVHDLSKPLPQYSDFFDLVVSNMVLMDVFDYLGFVSTLSSVTKTGGHVVLSMHNPYASAPLRKHRVKNYFDSGPTTTQYYGLAQLGVFVYYCHRTLEEYITAFVENEFLLKSLSDVRPTEEMLQHEHARTHYQFPLLMILEFIKQ